MNLSLERIVDPEIEPLTLAEMRRHLRCYEDTTSEDDDIEALIVAAREWVENYTGRALIDQTWRLMLGDFIASDTLMRRSPITALTEQIWRLTLANYGSGGLALRRSPVIAVTKFAAIDAAGVETDIATTQYELREPGSKWPRIVPLSGAAWSARTLKVEFRAGFADRLGSPKQDAAKVPTRFKQAMKLWAEANYDRDPVMMPLLLKVAEDIVRPERVDMQMA